MVWASSAAAAHAHPRFELAETGASEGDVVHFTVSETDGRVTYELEVEDEDVLEGTGDGDVSGAFTMPDLGEAARTVTVEAEIHTSKKHKRIKHKFQYLGPARAAASPEPAAPPPAVAPAAAPAAVAPAAPVHTPNAIVPAAPAAPTSVTGRERRTRARGRHARERTDTRVRRRGNRSRRAERRRAGSPRRGERAKRRAMRSAARTAPLFDGVPERGSGGTAAESDRPFALNAIAPRAAVLSAAAARPREGDGDAAFLVPALLALAAFAVAGTAALRRRQLRRR